MIDGNDFRNSKEFIDWYMNLNLDDTLDMGEAMLIFFNQETYEECI